MEISDSLFNRSVKYAVKGYSMRYSFKSHNESVYRRFMSIADFLGPYFALVVLQDKYGFLSVFSIYRRLKG